MDKFDIVEHIIIRLNGVSGTEYQYEVRKVLRAYYKIKEYNYEMPRHYGGDKSNDGWVEDTLLYYQIYSPIQLNKSLKKDIQKKFRDDLSSLLENIFHHKLWGKDINEFIFIVNTFDTELPEDSERYFDKVVTDLQNNYNCKFKYKVVNNDYIRDLLMEINDIETLLGIASHMRIKNSIIPGIIDESIMIELISSISTNIHEDFINGVEDDYTRISTPEKIEVNQLHELKEEINKIMENLGIVDRSISLMNYDLCSEDRFQKVRKYIIDLYLGYKEKEISNIDILKGMHNDILELVDDKGPYIHPAKYLLVYIFDHCDIFEKE